MGYRKGLSYFWSDPDDGQCSNWVFVDREDGDTVWVFEKNDDGTPKEQNQVSADEIYTRKEAEAPRYVIARVNDGKIEFWNITKYWGSFYRASCFSMFEYDSYQRGDHSLPDNGEFLALPEEALNRILK